MGDRTDIDALLISALYGELTPADEARLAAHLESHPADRTALADLTHTRATVRESGILAAQLEPPQSVSALLLQEAARRAPSKPQETAGWFQRLARSFMAHPAMAAAAMLLLVVSVAGTIYVRHGADAFAPTAFERAEVTASSASAPAHDVDTTGKADESKSADVRAAAGSSAYRVGLDEAPGKQVPMTGDDEKRAADRGGLAVSLDGKEAPRAENQASSETLGKISGVAKPARPSTKTAGIELRKPEPQPKDFDDNEKDSGAVVRNRRQAGREANLELAPDPAPPSGGAATPAAAKAPQAQPAPAPALKPPAANTPPGASATGAKSKAKTLSRGDLAQEQAADAPPPPASPPPASATPAPSTGNAAPSVTRFADKLTHAENRLSDDTVSDSKTVLGWARKQHDQVIALVKSSNCRAAATAAIEIYSRAPDYYAANVATDRSVKPCLPYLNSERQREDRSRAAKRALSDDAAAPAAKPAPPVRK